MWGGGRGGIGWSPNFHGHFFSRAHFLFFFHGLFTGKKNAFDEIFGGRNVLYFTMGFIPIIEFRNRGTLYQLTENRY